MPIYEYKCEKCGSEFEKIVKNNSEKVTCPDCSGKKCERQLSVFAAQSSDGPGKCPVGETCPSASSAGCGGCCGMPR